MLALLRCRRTGIHSPNSLNNRRLCEIGHDGQNFSSSFSFPFFLSEFSKSDMVFGDNRRMDSAGERYGSGAG